MQIDTTLFAPLYRRSETRQQLQTAPYRARRDVRDAPQTERPYPFHRLGRFLPNYSQRNLRPRRRNTDSELINNLLKDLTIDLVENEGNLQILMKF